jgi:hypothetical protein
VYKGRVTSSESFIKICRLIKKLLVSEVHGNMGMMF